MLNKTGIIFVTAVLFAGCTTGSYDISEETKTRELIENAPEVSDEQSYFYVRAVSNKEELDRSSNRVGLPAKASLRLILQNALPNYRIIAGDIDVKLDQEYKVNFPATTVGELLDLLEGMTGYEYEINGRRLDVRSFVTRTINMQPFANTRSLYNQTVAQQGAGLEVDGSSGSESSGGGESEEKSVTRIETVRSEDEWLSHVEAAKKILGVKDEDTSSRQGGAGTNPLTSLSQTRRDTDIFSLGTDLTAVEQLRDFRPQPYVIANRSSGLIQIGGPAYKVKQVAHFYHETLEKVVRNIHVSFKVYEVSLTEGKQKDVDWGAIYENLDDTAQFGASLGKSFLQEDPGLFTLGASYQNDNWSATGFVSFLESFGDVTALSQPSLVGTHGTPVVSRSGDSIPVLLQLSQVVSGEGLSQSGGEISQLDVGINITTTSWVLDSGKILVDVMPSLSSVTGQTTFTIGGAVLPVPNITATEVATRVVVEPGRPMVIAGLSRDKIIQKLDGMPISNGVVKGVLDVPFGSVNNQAERTQLVIVMEANLTEGNL